MVYILLAPGFEEMEALVPADLLRRADIPVSLVGVGEKTVAGGRGFPVVCDLTMDEIHPREAEMVVLPGGGVGVTNLGEDPRVEQLVRSCAEADGWIAAICAAPSLLSRWGMLAGKNAVCYPTWSDRIPDANYLPGEKLAVEGKIITGQAAGTSFEFGLKLIEVLRGEETSLRIRKEICL